MAIEGLKGSLLFGAVAATIIGGIAAALFLNEQVVGHMKTQISQVMGDIEHDEADHMAFDFKEYTDLISNLHTDTLLTVATDAAAAIGSIGIGAVVAFATGGAASGAASTLLFGVGAGSTMGAVLMMYIDGEVTTYDDQTRAGI